MLIKKVTVEKAVQIIKDKFDQLDKFRNREVEIINELDLFSNEVENLLSTSLEVIKKVPKYSNLLIEEIQNIERLLDVNKIAEVEHGKEITRITEFRSKSSQFYGEISNLLDQYILEN